MKMQTTSDFFNLINEGYFWEIGRSNNYKEIGAFKLVKVRVKKAKRKAKSVILHPSLILSGKGAPAPLTWPGAPHGQFHSSFSFTLNES
jgi:hypothetical protein